MITNPVLLPKVRSTAIMQAMAGLPCALRISSFYPGHRCAGADTVVGCHLPTIGKSMGSKVSDLFVVAGCFHCHQILDGRDPKRRDFIMDNYPTAITLRMLDGLAETQSRLVGLGILTCADMEIC